MAKAKSEVSIAVMATDIQYIKDSIKRIETTMQNIDGLYVKVSDFSVHLKEHSDFEKRLRDVEIDNASFKSQVRTWGVVGMIVLGLAQFFIGKFL